MIVKNVEKKDNKTAVFQVETDAAEFEAAVNESYLKNKKNINIPGFRKGKAPRAVVEGMYGADAFYQDALDLLGPNAFEFAMKETKLRIVGTPALVDLNVTDEHTAQYTFSVTLYPEVKLGQYKGIEAYKEKKEVTDEDMERELNNIRTRNSRQVGVEGRSAQEGDTVTINFDGYLNGERFEGGKAEDYPLELGSHAFVPGFEEQIIGMNIGEEKDLDITFPENYTTELAGKEVVFKVKVNDISVTELPELDDEFAKDVSEFDTMEEYKADIRKNLQNDIDEQCEAHFRSDVMAKACENMEVEVPDAMVDDKVEEIVRSYAANYGMNDRSTSMEKLTEMLGLSEQIFNENIRPGALMQVKSEILIDAIIKAENIQVSDDEMKGYIEKVAESIQAKPEDIKSYFGDHFIVSEKRKDKATAIIFDTAVATDVKPEEKAEEKAE